MAVVHCVQLHALDGVGEVRMAAKRRDEVFHSRDFCWTMDWFVSGRNVTQGCSSGIAATTQARSRCSYEVQR